VTGDAARYERYRDLGDGLFFDDARASCEFAHWVLEVSANHVGRRDQRYTADFVRPGRLKASLLWDQIPMLLSNSTRTLFSGGRRLLTTAEFSPPLRKSSRQRRAGRSCERIFPRQSIGRGWWHAFRPLDTTAGRMT
jgi:hypothetical protein